MARDEDQKTADGESTKISVDLPFLRSTKNMHLYGVDRDVAEAMDPDTRPAITSLYISKAAIRKPFAAITVVVQEKKNG